MSPAHGGRRTQPLPSNWTQLRKAVLDRSRGRCAINGCPRRATDVDHIMPASEGGGDELSNLQALCGPHHLRKTGKEAARARSRKRSRFREPEPHPGSVEP